MLVTVPSEASTRLIRPAGSSGTVPTTRPVTATALPSGAHSKPSSSVSSEPVERGDRVATVGIDDHDLRQTCATQECDAAAVRGTTGIRVPVEPGGDWRRAPVTGSTVKMSPASA